MEARYDFTGARVVVTGGSSGIGRGIAEAFLKAGAEVAICARKEAALLETRDRLAALGRVHAFVCDVSDQAAVQAFVANAAEAMGGIDILINNAASISRGDSVAVWQRTVNIDLIGTIGVSEAALPWLERAEDGVILHIGSISSTRPSRVAPAYAACKAALSHYTASQALALIPKGIRVNCVAPGMTTAEGHFWEARRENNDPAYADALSKQPTGRLGTDKDIANVIMFLASRQGAWILGQTIIADGGILINGG